METKNGGESRRIAEKQCMSDSHGNGEWPRMVENGGESWKIEAQVMVMETDNGGEWRRIAEK